MNVMGKNVLSIFYRIVFFVSFIYFVGIAFIPWSGMHIFAEDRSKYYTEWRSFVKTTEDTIRRLCAQDPNRYFVLNDDDRVSPYFWYDLNMTCPIIRPTIVTPLPADFLNKCEVVLIIEVADYMPPDRVTIAHSESITGKHFKDYTVYRECVPS